MKHHQAQPIHEMKILLSRLRQHDATILFDFLEDTRFWIKDAAGRYLRINRTFQLQYNLTNTDEAIGLTDFDLSPPWIAEAFRSDDQVVLAGKRVVNRIELVNGFDQAFHWYQTYKVPLRDDKGIIAATAGTARLLPGLKASAFPVPKLAPALAALQDESVTSLTNVALARLAGMSVSAFERLFRHYLQTSPMQFHRRLRLARAASSLIQTTNTIAEIALSCGFSDQSHLTRQFKQMYQLTPSAWRARHFSVT